MLKHWIYVTDLTKKAAISTECKCFFIFNLEFFFSISIILWFSYFEVHGNYICTQENIFLWITSSLYLSKAYVGT